MINKNFKMKLLDIQDLKRIIKLILKNSKNINYRNSKMLKKILIKILKIFNKKKINKKIHFLNQFILLQFSNSHILDLIQIKVKNKIKMNNKIMNKLQNLDL